MSEFVLQPHNSWISIATLEWRVYSRNVRHALSEADENVWTRHLCGNVFRHYRKSRNGNNDKNRQYTHVPQAFYYSLEFARPTMLSIWRSSLNLSNMVPLTASCFSSCFFWTTPQHSITSGRIRLAIDRQGLSKVVHANVCPWSKLAEMKRPKWFTRPPKPIPFGISSELKFTAHCRSQNRNETCSAQWKNIASKDTYGNSQATNINKVCSLPPQVENNGCFGLTNP